MTVSHPCPNPKLKISPSHLSSGLQKPHGVVALEQSEAAPRRQALRRCEMSVLAE
jgi:hypothetical protein